MLVPDPSSIALVVVELLIMLWAITRVIKTNAITREMKKSPPSGMESDLSVLTRSHNEAKVAIAIPGFFILLFVGLNLLSGAPFQVEQDSIGTAEYAIGTIGIFILFVPLSLFVALRLTGWYIIVSGEGVNEFVVRKSKRAVNWNSVKTLERFPENDQPSSILLKDEKSLIVIKTGMNNVDRFYELALVNLPNQFNGSPAWVWMSRKVDKKVES